MHTGLAGVGAPSCFPKQEGLNARVEPAHDLREPDLSNFAFQTITALILLIHVAVFAWAISRRTTKPLAGLNLLGAALLWLISAPRLSRVIASGDIQVVMFLAVALLSAVASLVWLAGWRIPSFVIWLFFAAQTTASVLAALFAFTFKMGRLF